MDALVVSISFMVSRTSCLGELASLLNDLYFVPKFFSTSLLFPR